MSEDENVKIGTSWISNVSSFIETSSDIQYYHTIDDITDERIKINGMVHHIRKCMELLRNGKTYH